MQISITFFLKPYLSLEESIGSKRQDGVDAKIKAEKTRRFGWIDLATS